MDFVAAQARALNDLNMYKLNLIIDESKILTLSLGSAAWPQNLGMFLNGSLGRLRIQFIFNFIIILA